MIIRTSISPHLQEVSFREEFQIVRIGKFDSDLVEHVEKTVSKAHNTGQPIIPFVIDSSGGSVFALQSIYETVQASEIPVVTFVKGKALSSGLILLGLGDEGRRFASPHAAGMIHEITWGKRDKISETESMIEYARHQNDEMFRELARRCGHDEEYFLDLMYENRNKDVWLTPEDLKRHNLIDHIGRPKIEVEVSVNWNMKQTIR